MWWLTPIIVPIWVNWTDKQQIFRDMRLLAALWSLKMRRANTCLAKFYCNYIQDYWLTSMWLLIPVIVQIGVNWTNKQQIFRPTRLPAAVQSLKMRRANTWFSWQSFTVTYVQDDCLTSMWWLIPIIVPIGVIWKYKQHISRSLRLPTAVWSLKIHRANTCFAWQSFTVTFKYT